MRLLDFLIERKAVPSRTKGREWIRAGKVRVDFVQVYDPDLSLPDDPRLVCGRWICSDLWGAVIEPRA